MVAPLDLDNVVGLARLPDVGEVDACYHAAMADSAECLQQVAGHQFLFDT